MPGTRATPKRDSILDGALDVFAHEGFSRASIDTIATRAGTSTRTLYKYFPSKVELFRAVVEFSTSRAAEAHLALLAEHLPGDAEPDALRDFALAWVIDAKGHRQWARHELLVRHLTADVDNIPEDIVSLWLDTGPRRVIDALAQRMRAWGESGALSITDPARAAAQFAQLVTPGAAPGIDPSFSDDPARWVDAAVDLFFDGCRPESSTSTAKSARRRHR